MLDLPVLKSKRNNEDPEMKHRVIWSSIVLLLIATGITIAQAERGAKDNADGVNMDGTNPPLPWLMLMHVS